MADISETSFGKTFGKVISLLLCHCVISYHGMSFVFEDLQPSLAMWGSLYYVGHWGCLLVIVISIMLPKYKRPKVAAADVT